MKKTIVCSLVCCGLLFAGCGSNKTNTTPDNTGANTIVTGSTDTGHVYTNDQYGFRFEYPASATVTGQFARFYILATGWMSEDQESAS